MKRDGSNGDFLVPWAGDSIRWRLVLLVILLVAFILGSYYFFFEGSARPATSAKVPRQLLPLFPLSFDLQDEHLRTTFATGRRRDEQGAQGFSSAMRLGPARRNEPPPAMRRSANSAWLPSKSGVKPRSLLVSLPTPNATARMRIWRAVKSLGCMALRDGAYLLPEGAQREQALQELADECTREGGTAWLMTVLPRSAGEAEAYRQLFDRTEDYADLRKSWKESNRTLASLPVAELARLRRKLLRDYDAVRATEFFPGEASVEAEAAWTDLSNRIESLLSPDEPHDTAGLIPRLDSSKYQGRAWATRRRLWADRVASAWLIRRFIDRDARFQWLAKPSDCPWRSLGFDFDGAAFTHVGDRVTFETLLASFDLEGDAALVRLAAMVHQLDVGGEPVPEAAGFEAVMSGARERLPDDDALLAEMSAMLDSLYSHFEREAVRAKS